MAVRVTYGSLEHPKHTLGFHNAYSVGAGQERRAELFEAFSAKLSEMFTGLFEVPAGQAWAEANELVEGSGIDWAYHRVTGDGTSFTARGSC